MNNNIKNIGMRLLPVLLVLVSSPSWAGQSWECRDAMSALAGLDAPVLLTATVSGDGETGRIEVAGTSHRAWYGIDGLSGKWYWGLEGDQYRFVFTIRPDGNGVLYDFGSPPQEKAETVFIYTCRPGR
jgi:hypothetical protein